MFTIENMPRKYKTKLKRKTNYNSKIFQHSIATKSAGISVKAIGQLISFNTKSINSIT